MTQIGIPPEHTPLGARLRERTSPMALEDADHGYAHAHLSEALGRPLLQLQEAFDPLDAAPFETLLDPARCPEWALPWLAQLVGLTLPGTADAATKRAAIVELGSQKRGTVPYLRAAAGLYLTGTKTVYFRERDPSQVRPSAYANYAAMTTTGGTYATQTGAFVDYRQLAGIDQRAYELEVVTLASETPDPAKVLAALTAQKPGGIVLRYYTVAGWDYQQMTTEGGAYSALGPKFASYRDLAYNERTT